MSSVKAYGQFEERKGYIFRPKAYLQWGTSTECLLKDQEVLLAELVEFYLKEVVGEVSV